MSELTYVGVDPGDTTGIFIVSFWWTPGLPTPITCRRASLEYPVGDIDRRMRIEIRNRPRPIRVACEKFAITHRTLRTKRRPAALEITGIVRDFAADHSAHLGVQQKSEAKKIGSTDRLKEWNWYIPGFGHANDAARHVVKMLADRDPLLFKAIINRGIVTIASKAIKGSEED